MTSDLAPILLPIIVSVALSVTGALIVARYAGPAQEAYVQALKGRLAVVEEERDDAALRIPELETRIKALEEEVGRLRSDLSAARDREFQLLRRLEADERRMPR